jgi:hypothetical protein
MSQDPQDQLEELELGPIDYLVIEFPGNRMTGEGFPLLLDLVERGVVRLLDLVFITKDEAGDVGILEMSQLGDELAEFAGARSGLLGDDDITEAALALEPNCSAALLVYENTWAAPLATALRRGGAQLVASGRIPIQAILAALEADAEADAAIPTATDV